MKRSLILLLLILLPACNTSRPAPQAISSPPNPSVSSSPVPSIPPSLIPSLAPSPVPSTSPASKPSPVPSADASTNEPTRAPVQSVAEVLLPVLEMTIELGPADFEQLNSSQPMALDDQADRLYVSLSPSRTVVLDAGTFAPGGEIPAGGTLGVNSVAQRLYVGVPGSYAYQADGTSVITSVELELFDTTNLALLRSLVLSDTSIVPPLVTADPFNNKAYITQIGVTIADATTLDTIGTLSGTFPVPNGLVPNYSAVEAVVIPQQQRLFVSLNNGIPGSNNGNVLAIYDLTSGQVIAQDPERSVSGFAVDETTGEVVSPRSYIDTAAIVKYDAQGRVLRRLDGASGRAQIDPQHNRVYLVEGSDPWCLKVLDRDLNFLGVIDLPGRAARQGFIFDAERDRLLILQNDGKLLVLKGQGQPLGAQRADTAVIPVRHSVLSIQPSPGAEQWFAIFAPDEYTSGYGAAFRSDDAGVTWKFAAGLPAAVTDLKSADRTIYAAVGGNGVTRGYGIWRSDDGGQVWRPSSHGLTDLGITRLAVSPDFARDGILVALSKRGVFRSTNRGATWTSLIDRYALLLKDLTVSFSAIALSPNFAHDDTVLIGHSSGLWRSTDRGETWTAISGGPPATRLAYAPDGSIVFATAYDGVHRSSDGGLTWSNVSTGLDVSNGRLADVQVSDREALVLLTSFDQPGAVYRLPLNETMWQRLPIELDVTALAVLPDGGLLIGTRDGLMKRYP